MIGDAYDAGDRYQTSECAPVIRDQRFIFKGKQLRDESVCQTVGIVDRSVHLVLRLKGN